MDRKELNQEKIDLGKKVLIGLDQDEFPVAAAFWLLDTDAASWKYMIASSVLDEVGPIAAYQKFLQELEKIVDPRHDDFSHHVSLISPSSPLVRLLKVAVNTGPTSVSGIRFTGNVINNQYIDDAYLYRVS